MTQEKQKELKNKVTKYFITFKKRKNNNIESSVELITISSDVRFNDRIKMNYHSYYPALKKE